MRSGKIIAFKDEQMQHVPPQGSAAATTKTCEFQQGDTVALEHRASSCARYLTRS